MSKSISLTLTQDEVEMVIDALEVDLEGYEDSVKDARANGNRTDVQTFSEAGARIKALIERLRPLVD